MKRDYVRMFGRTWIVVNDFTPRELIDWIVITTKEGVLWMNNVDGVIHFVCEDGTILKDYI